MNFIKRLAEYRVQECINKLYFLPVLTMRHFKIVNQSTLKGSNTIIVVVAE